MVSLLLETWWNWWKKWTNWKNFKRPHCMMVDDTHRKKISKIISTWNNAWNIHSEQLCLENSPDDLKRLPKPSKQKNMREAPNFQAKRRRSIFRHELGIFTWKTSLCIGTWGETYLFVNNFNLSYDHAFFSKVFFYTSNWCHFFKHI